MDKKPSRLKRAQTAFLSNVFTRAIPESTTARTSTPILHRSQSVPQLLYTSDEDGSKVKKKNSIQSTKQVEKMKSIISDKENIGYITNKRLNIDQGLNVDLSIRKTILKRSSMGNIGKVLANNVVEQQPHQLQPQKDTLQLPKTAMDWSISPVYAAELLNNSDKCKDKLPAPLLPLVRPSTSQYQKDSDKKLPVNWAPKVKRRRTDLSDFENVSIESDHNTTEIHTLLAETFAEPFDLIDETIKTSKQAKMVFPYFQEYLEIALKNNKDRKKIGASCSRKIRAVLVNWLVLLQVYFHQRSTVLHIAIEIFDTVLEGFEMKDAKQLELVALTSFWIANKMDNRSVSLTASNLLKVNKGQSFKKKDLCRCEFLIVKGLKFKFPNVDLVTTIISFQVSEILKIDFKHRQELEIRYFSYFFYDVSLLTWELHFNRTSLLTSASILCALAVLHYYIFLNEDPVNYWILLRTGNTSKLFASVSDCKDIIIQIFDNTKKIIENVNDNFNGFQHKYANYFTHFKNVLNIESIDAARTLILNQ